MVVLNDSESDIEPVEIEDQHVSDSSTPSTTDSETEDEKPDANDLGVEVLPLGNKHTTQ